MKPRTFLIIVLIVLLLLLGVLVYLYWALYRPSVPVISPLRVKGMTHLTTIYGYGDKPGELMGRPHGVAVDKDGNIYIADMENARILVFDKTAKFLFKFGERGTGEGQFLNPMGVAVAPNGRIYVTENNLSKVLIFNSKGKFIKEFGVMMPLMPTVALNKLYLTTYGHVIIYDLDGNELAKWGKKGKLAEQFDCPTGIAVDKAGNVYVSDTLNLRLQALNKDGEVLWVVGEPAKDIKALGRRFGLPAGLTIDENNLLYLADAFHFSIRVLNTKGKELAELGGELGEKEGQFNHAAGIASAGGGVFVVADKYNDRVQLLKISVPTSPE
ncbi:MAG: NHL repeat-containing protein [Actinomycetota bacterium]|nr:NHL repeat-containing protein [Actinomycetota bacterium]